MPLLPEQMEVHENHCNCVNGWLIQKPNTKRPKDHSNIAKKCQTRIWVNDIILEINTTCLHLWKQLWDLD